MVNVVASVLIWTLVLALTGVLLTITIWLGAIAILLNKGRNVPRDRTLNIAGTTVAVIAFPIALAGILLGILPTF